MRHFYGRDRATFSGTTPGGVTRQFTSFSQVRDDIVEARIWSGIHFRFADTEGSDDRAQGRSVGEPARVPLIGRSGSAPAPAGPRRVCSEVSGAASGRAAFVVRAWGRVRGGDYLAAVRLIVARCEVRYSGRLTAVLPEALRLLMLKSDGSVMVHADTGGFKPQNWMTPPTVIEEEPGLMVVRKRAGATEDKLEIRIAEVLSDVTHDMGEAAALEKEGVERELQELLADAPPEGLRLVRREWPTDIGPVDLMCRDEDDGFVAVEIKRVGTIDAVEQLTRYLERICESPGSRAAAACWPLRRSSRRRACSPSRAGSTASRSTPRAARRARAGPHPVRVAAKRPARPGARRSLSGSLS